MTDTGSFSFACNNTATFRTAAALIETGIDSEQIHRRVYDTYSESRLRLLGFCLSEKLTVWPELKSAYISLTIEELKRFNYKIGDTEGVVNYALSIEGVNVAVMLVERKDKIRMSFRSKGSFAVNEIARKHFEGGGHKSAAGGNSYISMEKTIEKLKLTLSQYKSKMLSAKI